MTQYKFKVGQTVRMVASRLRSGLPTGSFQIVRLLPEERGTNQYRIKSTIDGQERVVLESELT
jgi:hypothetical protein